MRRSAHDFVNDSFERCTAATEPIYAAPSFAAQLPFKTIAIRHNKNLNECSSSRSLGELHDNVNNKLRPIDNMSDYIPYSRIRNVEYNHVMNLQSQDVVVLLKLATYSEGRPPYIQIAQELFLSPSRIHAAVARARAARLVHPSQQGDKPNYKALQEFLLHGAKYSFPPQRGELTRGIPTAYAAPPLNNLISQPDEPPPVWPYSEGTVRGYAFLPLHKNVPKAALQDHLLYEMLALVDAIRDGRAREKTLAEKELSARLEKLAG
jgi:hypothetical protein